MQTTPFENIEFLGNELAIAGFMNNPDDPDLQCANLRRMADIFHVDIASINYDEMPRDQALERAKSEAVYMAVNAGAIRETVDIIEVEDVPLAYYPGNTCRVKVKAVGELK